MKSRKTSDTPECIGSTVVGERGQIVIPKEIRDRVNLKAGSRLLVIHHANGPVVLMPVEKMKKMITKMTKSLRSINS